VEILFLLFIYCVKKKLAFLKISWTRKSSQKLCFLQMYDNKEDKLYFFYHFPGLQNYWKDTYSLNFFVSRNFFNRDDLCQFLVSKSYDKIWDFSHIFYNFCVSENFDVSSV